MARKPKFFFRIRQLAPTLGFCITRGDVSSDNLMTLPPRPTTAGLRKMHKICGFTLLAASLILLVSVADAQQPIHWELSIENAKRVANQTNRLVLIEFSASWCGQCRIMESEVFSQPAVARTIEANYVPVRVNVDYAEQTARRYGITGLPTTVIIAPTPRGEVLSSIRGRVDAMEYMAMLNRVVAETRQRAAGPYAQISANSAGSSQPTPPGAALPAVPAGQLPPNPIRDTVVAAQAPIVASPVRQAPPAAPPTTAAAPPSNVLPLGLDGYCPVQLVEKEKWTRGDRRWGAIYEGRTYLFAGPEQQQRFLADPARYAPVNMGNDVVLMVDGRQTVAGRRAHGVYFDGHVYLFADEATLQHLRRTTATMSSRPRRRAGPAVRWPRSKCGKARQRDGRGCRTTECLLRHSFLVHACFAVFPRRRLVRRPHLHLVHGISQPFAHAPLDHVAKVRPAVSASTKPARRPTIALGGGVPGGGPPIFHASTSARSDSTTSISSAG